MEKMRRKYACKMGISLFIMCLMAIHCANPNLPIFMMISPSQNDVIPQDSAPYSLEVEVDVPLPGCGATTFPIDPATFSATLIGLLDGDVISEQDVTENFGEGVLDPQTGKHTWNGTVEIAAFGSYRIDFSVSNETGEGIGNLYFRLEQTVALFPGGSFLFHVSSLGQDPANCLLPNGLLPIILGIVGGTNFPLTLPSGADILASGNAYPITIGLPFPLGNVDAVLSLDEPNNDIVIDGPDDYTIDLTGLVPPPLTGFDCVITASAEGVMDDIDPNDLDGSLTIGITDVQASPGGTCTLSPPSGACDLIVGLDAL